MLRITVTVFLLSLLPSGEPLLEIRALVGAQLDAIVDLILGASQSAFGCRNLVSAKECGDLVYTFLAAKARCAANKILAPVGS